MNDNNIIEKIRDITIASITGFFAGFGKIKKSKDFDKVNNLLDGIMDRNFAKLKTIFKNYDENYLYKKYFCELEDIIGKDKNRYMKFIK
ncbi:hypothetical protein EOM39_06480 [Candidatus Gracilibacteria bacterium]|nr:hypothetical protein [Candidatus Gracilibacteria bacterium]